MLIDSICRIGSLPPSVAQGQSFVNDPSMTNSSEVKAHIKLRFNNKSGQPTVVARLYQVIRKKTKLEFKRLDGTVRTTGRRFIGWMDYGHEVADSILLVVCYDKI